MTRALRKVHYGIPIRANVRGGGEWWNERLYAVCGVDETDTVSVSFGAFIHLPQAVQCVRCMARPPAWNADVWHPPLITHASPEHLVAMEAFSILSAQLGDQMREMPHGVRRCWFDHGEYLSNRSAGTLRPASMTKPVDHRGKALWCPWCARPSFTDVRSRATNFPHELVRRVLRDAREAAMNPPPPWPAPLLTVPIRKISEAQATVLQDAYERKHRTIGTIPYGAHWRTAVSLHGMHPKLLAAVRGGEQRCGSIIGFHITPAGRLTLQAHYERTGVAKPSGLVMSPASIPPQNEKMGLEADNGICATDRDTGYMPLQGCQRGMYVDLPEHGPYPWLEQPASSRKKRKATT